MMTSKSDIRNIVTRQAKFSTEPEIKSSQKAVLQTQKVFHSPMSDFIPGDGCLMWPTSASMNQEV